MTEPNGKWETTDMIAARWVGLTPMRAEKLLRHLGLTRSERHAKVTEAGIAYSPDAVGLVERELRSRGCHERVCDCGARPDGTESIGCGDYEDEQGGPAWICLACWCVENYGRGSIEALEARRQQRKASP